jgi:hypothetical protein
VASVRETLLNLTSRLGLVDIFSAADRNAANLTSAQSKQVVGTLLFFAGTLLRYYQK